MHVAPYLFAFLIVAQPAFGSQPESETHGMWSITSISSLAGTEGDDASVVLAQGEHPDTIEVRWLQGGPVTISINIEHCREEDDFEAGYTVDVAQWLTQADQEVYRRLQRNFETWIGQARLSCEEAASASAGRFELGRLREAVEGFGRRLRHYAS